MSAGEYVDAAAGLVVVMLSCAGKPDDPADPISDCCASPYWLEETTLTISMTSSICDDVEIDEKLGRVGRESGVVEEVTLI
jgi:hypothetical protein